MTGAGHTAGRWYVLDQRASTLKAAGWEGEHQDAILISALSPKEIIAARGENAIIARIEFRNRSEQLTDGNFADARLIVAACNSYDRHFGPRAVEAAEGDLLGRCLDVLGAARAVLQYEIASLLDSICVKDADGKPIRESAEPDAGDADAKRMETVVAKIDAILSQAQAREKEIDLFEVLRDESWDLRCFPVPTGGDDADIGWRVVGHWMAEPRERVVAEIYHDDPRAAVLAALEAQAQAREVRS